MYNLMDDIDIPVIPLMSTTDLKNKKGAINYFSMQKHETSLADIIAELKRQVPLLQEDELSVNDLIIYLKGVVGELDKEKTLTDIVLLNFWAGNIEQAEQEIKNGKNLF